MIHTKIVFKIQYNLETSSTHTYCVFRFRLNEHRISASSPCHYLHLRFTETSYTHVKPGELDTIFSRPNGTTCRPTTACVNILTIIHSTSSSDNFGQLRATLDDFIIILLVFFLTFLVSQSFCNVHFPFSRLVLVDYRFFSGESQICISKTIFCFQHIEVVTEPCAL